MRYTTSYGKVATVTEVAQIGCELIGDVSIEIVDDTDLDWAAQHLSLSRARTDLGYRVGFDLVAFVRDYVNKIRNDFGLPPIN